MLLDKKDKDCLARLIFKSNDLEEGIIYENLVNDTKFNMIAGNCKNKKCRLNAQELCDKY